MHIDKRGATRVVIVMRHIVIKIPSITSWKLFLLGLLANMQERQFSTMRDPNLCPVITSSRFGFFVVMPRCHPIRNMGLYATELYRIRGSLPRDFYISDAKPENFGYMRGRLVKLDYGN